MPIKKVEAHETTVRGETCWRVIIPSELTGGVQKRRFFKTKKEAEAFAKTVEQDRLVNQGGVRLLPMADQVILGRLLDRCGGLTGLEAASDYWLTHRPKNTISLADLRREVLDAKEKAGRADTYLGLLRSTLKTFIRHREEQLADTVTPREIETWLHSLGKAIPTLQGYLKDVRTMFSYAVDKGYVKENPALRVETPESASEPPGILSVPECERLLWATLKIDPALAPYVALCLFGGIRPSETRRLSWERVKEEYVEIQAKKAKTKARRLVTINPTLRAWLALGGDLPIVNFRRRFRDVYRSAKVNWSKDCMRHSFCSYGLPVWGVARVTSDAGHSEQVLFSHYRELVTKKEAEGFWTLTPEAVVRRALLRLIDRRHGL